jgi:hypothetical protein
MALFDSSMFDTSNYGGVLGQLLQRLQMPQPTPSTGFPDSTQSYGAGGIQYPVMGQPTGMDLSAREQTVPQAAPQPQPTPPQQLPSALQSPAGGNIGAGLMGLLNAGSPLQGLGNLISGLATGQRTDPSGMAQQSAQATYQALKTAGVPDGVAQAAALNPEVLKTIAPQLYSKPKAMLVPGLGGSQIQFVDEPNMTINGKPVSQGGGQSGNLDEIAGKIGQLRSSGAPQERLLQQIPPAMREAVSAMLEGRAIPQNFSFRGDARNGAILLAHAIDPNFDEGQLAARQQFAKDLGNTKSGLGFRIESGKKMLNHMESLAGNLDKLHNLDNPGGMLGYITPDKAVETANAIGNNQPAQKAIANEAQNIAQSFSQEKGKFLGGPSGGSMHEREKTVSAYDPNSPRSKLAGALQGDLDLFKGQFDAMNSQRDNLLGPGSTSTRFQVTTPEMEAQMERIQQKIDAIQGKKSSAGASAQAAPKIDTVQDGYRFRGGNPADKNNWVKVQ